MNTRLLAIATAVLLAVLLVVAINESLTHQVDSENTIPDNNSKKSCSVEERVRGMCEPFVFHRLDVVILPVTAEQFWALRDGEAVPFKNRTGYSPKLGAMLPLGNCILYDTLREDGAPLFSCTTIETGNQRRVFPVDPIALEILPEYSGPIPDGAKTIDTTYGVYGDTPYSEHQVSNKGMYAEVPGYGVYYFTDFDDKHIRLTQDNFQTSRVVKEVEGIRTFYSYIGL